MLIETPVKLIGGSIVNVSDARALVETPKQMAIWNPQYCHLRSEGFTLDLSELKFKYVEDENLSGRRWDQPILE